jgi:ABC-2 family transporter protein
VNPRRVWPILAKDLRDAWRDGRIIVLLLLPLGVGVFSALANDSLESLPTTRVAVVDRPDGSVTRELRAVTGSGYDVELTRSADAAAARRLVADEDVDLAVVTRARAPRELILVAGNAPPAAESIAALIPVALARAAGREPPAQPPVEVVGPADVTPADRIGQSFDELISILLFVCFVAMMVVPIQTAEERETGTFGALRLAATGPEILAAKALSGYVYGSAGVGLTVVLTGLDVRDPLLLAVAALALVVTLVGFGLLLGLLAPNSSAINTYAGFLVVPLIVSAGAVFAVEDGIPAMILDALPFTQATKLLADAIAPQPPFDAGPGAWVVIVVWAAVGYGILARIASRREL